MNVSFSFHLKHKNRNLSAVQRQSIQKLCRASMIHAKKRKKMVLANPKSALGVKQLKDSKCNAFISLDVIYDIDDEKIWTNDNPLLCSGYMSLTNHNKTIL